MRKKSINDLHKQADRIRAGYGWKARGKEWDYERYMAIIHKVEEIKTRYTRRIGEYQREAEGWTKFEQSRKYLTISNMAYGREIYAGY